MKKLSIIAVTLVLAVFAKAQNLSMEQLGECSKATSVSAIVGILDPNGFTLTNTEAPKKKKDERIRYTYKVVPSDPKTELVSFILTNYGYFDFTYTVYDKEVFNRLKLDVDKSGFTYDAGLKSYNDSRKKTTLTFREGKTADGTPFYSINFFRFSWY
jgi:hypothetical protein